MTMSWKPNLFALHPVYAASALTVDVMIGISGALRRIPNSSELPQSLLQDV
jgi:hypothetical protein